MAAPSGPWYRRAFAWEIPLLAALAAFMLWMRMLPAKTMVLGARAYYVGTDPYYHFRETLGIVRSFPRVPRWDPWTFYPHGTPTNQFGTLFDWLAAAYIVATEGKGASEEHVARVLGVYPAILGAILIVPFYFLAKRLMGKAGAVVASITLALLPGEFIVRTAAGYPDHHVAEALAALLSILAVYVAAQRGHAAREAIRSRSWGPPLRSAILFGTLGGIALAVNFYVWPPALLFLAILVVWLTIVILLETSRGQDPGGLALGGGIAFALAGLLMIPGMETTAINDFNAYGLLHVVAPLAAAAWLFLVDFGALASRRRRVPLWVLPSGVVALLAVALAGAYVFARGFVSSILWGLAWVTGIGTQRTTLTLSEASPTAFFCSGDTARALCLTDDFGIVPPVTFAILGVLAWWTFTRRRHADILLLVWSVVIFRAADTQVRFSYYLALNMALLIGWGAARAAEWVGLDAPREHATPADATRAKGRKAQAVERTRAGGVSRPLQLAAVGAILLLVLPGNVLASDDGRPVWKAAPREPDANLARWHDGLVWMRANTPDAGVDLALVVSPPREGELYDYPTAAYGVLSWADYGHWIEAIAHRPPVSNPFQQAAAFTSLWLTETDTARAEEMLDEWVQDKGPVRYVWIDDQMATGKYGYITVWAHAQNESRRTWSIDAFVSRDLQVNGTARKGLVLDEDYSGSMLARLYKDDAEGLSHYRLVYEHPAYTTIGSVIYDNGDQRCVNIELPSAPCPVAANASVVAQSKAEPSRAIRVFHDNNVYDVDVYSRLKLFERVEGAHLVGSTTPGANVSAQVALEARQPDGRVRAWTHEVRAVAGADGAFDIVFPYATSDPLAPEEGGTNAIVKAASRVSVRTPTGTAEIDVPERAVLEGATIRATTA